RNLVVRQSRHDHRLQVVGNLEGAKADGATEATDRPPLRNCERLEQEILGSIGLWAQSCATQQQRDVRRASPHCVPSRGLVPATIEWGLRRRKSASSRNAMAALSTSESVCLRSAASGACGEIVPVALSSVPRSASSAFVASLWSARVSS